MRSKARCQMSSNSNEPKTRRQPSLIGICHVWIRNVKILGYGATPNEFIPPGSVGDMEVQETSTDGRVIHACFHMTGEGHGRGYGSVMWPEWEYLIS